MSRIESEPEVVGYKKGSGVDKVYYRIDGLDADELSELLSKRGAISTRILPRHQTGSGEPEIEASIISYTYPIEKREEECEGINYRIVRIPGKYSVDGYHGARWVKHFCDDNGDVYTEIWYYD